MACCSEKQTECLKVITIGYLKAFIRDSANNLLIQNSSGGAVDVNLNALAAANRRNDYCPTYGELTGGSLIQLGRRASSPNGDVDGIVVSSVYTGGGSSVNYRTNQEVNQKDLSLIWTRYSSFSISASKTSVSECGDSSNICYSHSYVRYSKQMNTSCSITSGSTATTDTTDSEVTLTTSSFGSFGNWSSHCKALSIPKNGTIQSPSRSTTVTGRIVFRNSTKTSSVTITQAALTGNWNLHHRVHNGLTISADKSNTFEDCNAGTITGNKTHTYTEYFEWLDSCGKHYTEAEKAYSAASRTSSTAYTVNYSATEKDCEVDKSTTKVVSASATLNPVTSATQTYSTSRTFTITCTHDPYQDKCCPTYTDYGEWDSCNSSNYGHQISRTNTVYRQRKVNGVCQVDWTTGTATTEYDTCCITCDYDYDYGVSSLVTKSVDCDTTRVKVSASVPYTYTAYTPDNTCKECVFSYTGSSSSYESDYVSIGRNCGSTSKTHSGTTYSGIKYKITQRSGSCTGPIKPVDQIDVDCDGTTGQTMHKDNKRTDDGYKNGYNWNTLSITCSGNIKVYDYEKNVRYAVEWNGSKSWDDVKSGAYCGTVYVSWTSNGTRYSESYRVEKS